MRISLVAPHHPPALHSNQILERHLENVKQVYVYFADLEKVCDRALRRKLWGMLLEQDYDPLMRAIQSSYNDGKSCVGGNEMSC